MDMSVTFNILLKLLLVKYIAMSLDQGYALEHHLMNHARKHIHIMSYSDLKYNQCMYDLHLHTCVMQDEK